MHHDCMIPPDAYGRFSGSQMIAGLDRSARDSVYFAAAPVIPDEYGLSNDSHWVARLHERLREQNPRGTRPDSFYKIDSAVLYVSRHF